MASFISKAAQRVYGAADTKVKAQKELNQVTAEHAKTTQKIAQLQKEQATQSKALINKYEFILNGIQTKELPKTPNGDTLLPRIQKIAKQLEKAKTLNQNQDPLLDQKLKKIHANIHELAGELKKLQQAG